MWTYFTDPVLRAPTIGSMLMCLAVALVGVLVFVRKRSLLGETLSHASYPGVVLAVIGAGLFYADLDEGLAIWIIVGAFLSALLGLWAVYLLERHLKVRSDSALCFVLSAFFGVGLTGMSYIQQAYTTQYRQVQAYLFGQAATMTDIHIVIYGALSALIIVLLIFFFKELKAINFDTSYAKCIGIKTAGIEAMVALLVVLSIVIGIRSVGVVLMSAMLIAPAAAARQFTHKLSTMMVLAACFGLLSGYFGNVFSAELSQDLTTSLSGQYISLPTGPMIVLTAALFCLLALFFAPERGVLFRVGRVWRFRLQCAQENMLKAIWRHGAELPISYAELHRVHGHRAFYLRHLLHKLMRQGWIRGVGDDRYVLTHDGRLRAARIVRLHRLWEVYLASYLGVGRERVHRNAEEMEHIITPELEAELTALLHDPKRDPHEQPIPSKEPL